MKVLTAMYTLKKGGAYDRFKMMIESFLEKQWEVHCLSLTPMRIEHTFFHNHIMYFPFKKGDGFIAQLLVLLIFPPWSIWIGWKNKIDLIIAFGSLYGFIQCLSKWFLRRPMVTLIRGNFTFALEIQDSPKYLLYLNRSIEKIGLKFSDRIIVTNMAAQGEILKGLGKRKKIDIQVLYNNIPPMHIRGPEGISGTREKYGLSRDAKVLVTAGILNKGKNIEMLIGCLPNIELKNIYVVIVGDGSREADFHYKDSLKRLAKKLEVEKRVIFTGWLEKEDLWKIYLTSDLFLLPSLSEGMSNAMLEALGLGLPCMGSDIPGIRDILQHKELLFDPRDEIDLVNKIHRIFSDDQFFNQMKRLCEERKEFFNFDWKEKLFQTVTMGFNGACQRR